jgi:hypothetical protein
VRSDARRGFCYDGGMRLRTRSLHFAAAAMTLALAAPALPAPAASVSRVIPSRGARTLVLDTAGGAVTLTPVAGTAIRVTADGFAANATPDVSWTPNGTRLTVRIQGPGGGALLPFAPASSVRYAIAYPAALHLSIRSSSGNLHLIAPTAPVEVYAEAGNVVVDAPRASITAQSASGDLTVTNARRAVDLAADDGDVAATIAKGWSGREIRLLSSSGAIHLTLPSGFRGHLDATAATPSRVHDAFGSLRAPAPLIWLYAPGGDVWISSGP